MGELRFPRTRSLPSMIAVAVAQRMEDKASLIPSGMGDPSSDSKPAAARSVGAAAIAFAGMERDEDVTESTSTSDDPFDVAVASLPAVDGDAVAGSNSQTIQSADVVCGRGKMAFNHEGNKRFRAAVAQSVDRYTRETNLRGKPAVVQSIIDGVHESGGRFLKRDRHRNWVELSAQEQKDKVRHAIRDVAADLARRAKQQQQLNRTMQHFS